MTILETHLNWSALGDLFTYDDSPLPGEDVTRRRPASNHAFPKAADIGTIKAVKADSFTFAAPPPFVEPFYNYVQLAGTTAPMIYTHVCNQCGATVVQQYQFQHSNWHREQHALLERLSRPTFVVGVDPATANPPAQARSGTLSATGQSLAREVCERENCGHEYKDHASFIGSTKGGRCMYCGCGAFLQLPF